MPYCPGCDKYLAKLRSEGICWTCEQEAKEESEYAHTGWANKDCRKCAHWTPKGCCLEAFRVCKPDMLALFYVPA